jgi:DNA-binding CsgD family transcriptional regulator
MRTSVRDRDLRDLNCLVGELAELVREPLALYTHMLDGLMRIIGADGGETSPTRDCVPGGAAFADHLIIRGFTRESERLVIAEGMGPTVANDPAIAEMMHLFGPRRVFTRLRRDLVTDATWSRSPYGDLMLHHNCVVDTIYSAAPAERSGDVFGVDLHRARPSPRFGEVERDLVHLFHQAMVYVYPKFLPLAPSSATREAAARLRPSHKATLRALLAGFGDKEIARRLGLSRYTVREYINAVFAHFGVASRAELLARFIPPDAVPD